LILRSDASAEIAPKLVLTEVDSEATKETSTIDPFWGPR
jgi:hypothetical protein